MFVRVIGGCLLRVCCVGCVWGRRGCILVCCVCCRVLCCYDVGVR